MFYNYPAKFQQYTRVTPVQFSKLESLVTPRIQKLTTTYREPIPARLRLLITLRFLATGDSLQSIATNFCIGKTTTRTIIGETCEAIWDALLLSYVKAPSSTGDWLKIADGFWDKWQLPNCVGAVDGKHVVMVAPRCSGSQYFNYKGSFSIVLMASCDSSYKFTTIDVGAYGRQSDGGVFSNSILGKKLENGSLKIGGLHTLPKSTKRAPLFFVGDEAFPLKSHLLRPFPGMGLNTPRRIFNYRLSRGRRVIENCFGILTSRFRIFKQPINTTPERASWMVKACVALHNFILIEEESSTSTTQSNNDVVNYRNQLNDTTNFNNAIPDGKDVRELMTNYFMNEGQVPWQFESVFNIDNRTLPYNSVA